MWECSQGVGGPGFLLFLSQIFWRLSETRFSIDVVDQKMTQPHEIDRAPDHERALKDR